MTMSERDTACFALTSATRYMIAGDWHANIGPALACLRASEKAGFNVTLHLGDFGILGNRTDYLGAVDNWLVKHDAWIFVTPGNHEDWGRILSLKSEGGMRKIGNRIWMLDRGFVWINLDRRWVSVGGAHSIDMNYRMPYIDWWPQETITLADCIRANENIHELGHKDLPLIMLCHDVPNGVDPPVREWPDKHQLLLSRQHQQVVSDLIDELDVNEVFHGHLHVRYDDVLWGEHGPVEVHGLASDGNSGTLYPYLPSG
jgi:predicted phosphodiesterase